MPDVSAIFEDRALVLGCDGRSDRTVGKQNLDTLAAEEFSKGFVEWNNDLSSQTFLVEI